MHRQSQAVRTSEGDVHRVPVRFIAISVI